MSEVLFNSARPLGRCENITAVWNAYDGAKRFEQVGYGDVSWVPHRVVVTDEFVTCKRPNQTVVMIAQRIASVRDADRIAVIEGGRITHCAPHEELLQISETYREIYASQSGKEVRA